MSSPVPPPPRDDDSPPPPPPVGAPPPPPPPQPGSGPPRTPAPPQSAANAGAWGTQPGQQAPPPAYGYTTPPKPPRPDVRPAAALIVAGAISSAIAVFLPWLTAEGETQTGTGVFLNKDFELYDSPGSGVLFFAAALLGLGIALFFAGRVLAVAIIAIVVASIALFVGLAMVGIVSDTKDLVGTGSLGIGVILLTPAAGLSLAGSIWATSKRRRW